MKKSVFKHESGHEKLAQEKLAQEKLAQEKLAQEKLAQEKLAQEKLAQEKLAQEKLISQINFAFTRNSEFEKTLGRVDNKCVLRQRKFLGHFAFYYSILNKLKKEKQETAHIFIFEAKKVRAFEMLLSFFEFKQCFIFPHKEKRIEYFN
jgi:hypothetical protein